VKNAAESAFGRGATGGDEEDAGGGKRYCQPRSLDPKTYT